jgi:hypothetical protein
MINLIICFIRRLVNKEFYKDSFIKFDPIHERNQNERNLVEL